MKVKGVQDRFKNLSGSIKAPLSNLIQSPACLKMGYNYGFSFTIGHVSLIFSGTMTSTDIAKQL